MQELSGSLKEAAGGIESLFQPVASGFPNGKEAAKVNNVIGLKRLILKCQTAKKL